LYCAPPLRTLTSAAPEDQELIDRLPYAEDAPFDSKAWQDDTLCLEDTRTEVLKDIKAWAYGEDESCIFWLNGAAGTGKSTIARTIARQFSESERKDLGASFFFARDRRDVAHAGLFFTSIARQLAIRRPALKQHIADIMRDDPDIGSKSRQDQWRRLIAHPLQKIVSDSQRAVVAIVVDALDECDNEEDIEGLITVLAQAKEVRNFRIRIIITSRPETPIRIGFRKMSGILHRDLLLHDVPREVVDGDIRLFLYNQFEEIKRAQEWVPDCWPGVDIVNQLVRMSEGLFIFAATVCRFVKDEEDAEDALVLFTKDEGAQLESSKTPFLDRIYNQILQRAADRTRNTAAVRDLLGAVTTLRDPLSPSVLARLLSMPEKYIHARLEQLHAVVRVPAKDDTAPIRLFHTSFRDFLLSKGRCQISNLCVNQKEADATLAESCMRVMSQALKQDICGFDAPGILVGDAEESQVEQGLPPDVQYACRYWIDHILKSGVKPSDNGEAHVFLQKHLLHWLEALGWMGKITNGVHDIAALESFISVSIPSA